VCLARIGHCHQLYIEAARQLAGEPDPGRQRDYRRDAGDDAEQAEPFAAPFGGKELGRERAGGPFGT
jgi:hypothetical protein